MSGETEMSKTFCLGVPEIRAIAEGKMVLVGLNLMTPAPKQEDPDLENRFTYHAPKPGQPEIYTKLRDTARMYAYLIKDVVPAGREQSLALTKLEEAVFWANAGIARGE